MAEEEADALPFAAGIAIPEDAELSPWAFIYWAAWHELSSDRPLGAMGGAGRIPWSSIVRYAEKNFPDDPDAESDLVRMLRGMDDVYLTWLAEEQERQMKSKA